MEKIKVVGIALIALLAITILVAPHMGGARVSPSGISFPGSQFSLPESLGLSVLGVGIIGLARIGRKKFLKP